MVNQSLSSLPALFTDRMRRQLGEEADAFFAALLTPSPVSIRLHPVKGQHPFQDSSRVPWCDLGYYLASRPAFHLDPLWHGCAYYVQEASSMILDHVLASLSLVEKPRIWVDMCAAPGGKTGILARHLKKHDVLVANEVVPQRKSILRENLIKAGVMNTFITGEQASVFTIPIADIMLIDAPCAGEGMMRKEPEAIRQWSPELVRSCSVMQQQIVREAARGLKQDGYLVYSTCSYSMDENIENVHRFYEEHQLASVTIPFPESWGISTITKGEVTGYQLYPHRVRGEGLFIAVLQKKSASLQPVIKRKQPANAFSVIPAWLQTHLAEHDTLAVLKNAPDYPVIYKEAEPLANEIIEWLPRAELIGETISRKGEDRIPLHFLAMSDLETPSYVSIDLEKEVALNFLERNTNGLPAQADHAWYKMCYEGLALGWAKNTRQGWKNHYPMAWRLRDRRIK